MKINDNPQLQQEAQQANQEAAAKPSAPRIPDENTVSNHINNYEAKSQADQAKRQASSQPIAQKAYDQAANGMRRPEQTSDRYEQLGLDIPLNQNEQQKALGAMEKAVGDHQFMPKNQTLLKQNPDAEKFVRECMMNNLDEDTAVELAVALGLLKTK